MRHSIKLVMAMMFLAGILATPAVFAEEAPAAPAATAAPAAEAAPTTAKMKIRVLGFLPELGGTGRLYFYNSEDTYNKVPKAAKTMAKKVSAMKKMKTKNEDGKEQAVWYAMVKDLKPGTYAISVIHDENDDNKMNQVMGFGPPTEGVGSSNHTGGQPKWKTAKFEVKAGDKLKEDIWIRYLFD